ncbi:hypothetical protein BIV59_06225 [Bacillus sp. MUM 13]|nr:hypothetical protein BIV59_06225 [Bacillus sp. MUM 13]
MMKRHEYEGNWKRFIIYTLVVGLIVGMFSVISDNLPDLSDGVTVPEFIISYLAVMINSLPFWFIFAMFVGVIFGRGMKESILFATIYTITAISLYFVVSNFYEDVPVKVSFNEKVITYAVWYGSSILGGIIGGISGFLIKKTPFILLIIPLGLILQLFLNGKSSWSDIVGIAQNVTYCLIIISIVIYLGIVKKKRKDAYRLDSEEVHIK